MAITEQVRQAVIDSGETHYRVGKESGVDTRVLDRFVNGETDDIMGRNIDKLADYLGLELCRKKRGTAPKQATKKPASSRKRTAKK